jgi:NAD(P)-dependent dehydrogenase (short-subunit alcohol dehydrogenase family)
MDLKLRGKVVVITGASRGIGRAIADLLAEEGARLVLAARSKDLLEVAAKQLGSDVLTVADDLRDIEAPARLIDAAVAQFGRIDVLVNNAGATKRGSLLELSDEDWLDGFALKFIGAMRCSRSAWPHLARSGGTIVNVVGVGGRTPSADFAIGGAVNAAALNLTKALADLGRKDGVRVNAVNPGSIATERLQRRIRSLATEQDISLDAAAQAMASRLMVDRFGAPAEVARVVAFLASSASAYCHGSIVDVDGGQTRTL